jgi:hypothetical protein
VSHVSCFVAKLPVCVTHWHCCSSRVPSSVALENSTNSHHKS